MIIFARTEGSSSVKPVRVSADANCNGGYNPDLKGGYIYRPSIHVRGQSGYNICVKFA